MTTINFIPIAELKQGISLSETIQAAGIELRHHGTRAVGLCPFHDEKTGSFFVFDNQRFHCFGCNISGDCIDFTQKFYGLNFKDALRHLGINTDTYPKGRFDHERFKKEKLKRELIQQFKTWRENLIDELATLVRASHTVISNIATEADLQKYGAVYDRLALWEYILFDILIGGDDRSRFELYRYMKGA